MFVSLVLSGKSSSVFVANSSFLSLVSSSSSRDLVKYDTSSSASVSISITLYTSSKLVSPAIAFPRASCSIVIVLPL